MIKQIMHLLHNVKSFAIKITKNRLKNPSSHPHSLLTAINIAPATILDLCQTYFEYLWGRYNSHQDTLW